MTFDISINLNEDQITHEITAAVQQAQKKLDAVVLNDANYFAPRKTGALINSGIENTVIGSGAIIWRTPYARRQYYGVNYDHSKQHNPNACAKWFEAAKARYFRKWEQIVNDCIKHN